MSKSRTRTAAVDDSAAPRSVTEEIVEAVADAEGASPLELQPLATVVDPDALEALFRSGTTGSVEFGYEGYRVTVDGDGGVAVTDAV